MSCVEEVKGFLQAKAAAAKSLFSLPSRKESMAGVIILYVFTNSTATAIWMTNAWTPFIYLTFDRSNWHVGLMSAVNGVFELSTAFVSGYLADHVLGPSRTLRYAVMFGIMTLSLVLIAVWSSKTWLLVLAQMCEGTYMGFSFTCLESVFAQCVRKGERDRLYSVKFAFEAAGPIVGLILTITLFSFVGDEWDKGILRSIITAGLVLHLGSLITFLCTFVPVPCHLDRQKPQVAAGDGTSGALGKASDVAVVGAAAATGETCEHEDARLPVEESDEFDLPPLYLSRRAEMINQALTAVRDASSFPYRLGGAYEPYVCTAHEGQHGDREEGDDAGSRGAVHTHSFSAGGMASTQFMDDRDGFSETNGGSFRQSREGGEADRQAAANEAAPSAHKPCRAPEGEETGRKIVGYRDVEYLSASPCRQKWMDLFPLKFYPAIVVAADVILITGSGMTTQYFSLFMMEIYGIRPVILNSLVLANAFIISFMAIVNGLFGKKYGRVRALLPTKCIGTCILLCMALSREHKGSDGSYPFIHPVKRVVMCICFTVRNAFMNCSSGLSRALIMDLVSEDNRGRWNALESVQSAGWSGTALLGGVVADQWGYGTSFLVTFAFHFFSCLMLTPLTVRNDSILPVPIYDDEEVEAEAAVAPQKKEEEDTSGSSFAAGRGLASPCEGEQQVAALTVENVVRIASSAVLSTDRPPNRTRRAGSGGSGEDVSRSSERREAGYPSPQ